MGSVGAAFGRNIRPRYRPTCSTSRTRSVPRAADAEQFIPARSLNLLAAAWIQFQVHDWVAHASSDWEERCTCRCPRDDWSNRPDGQAEGNADRRQQAARWQPDAALRQHRVALVGRIGSVRRRRQGAASLRDGAKIRLDNGYPAGRQIGMEVTGFNESWWLGLSALHTLFVREHNLLCDELRARYRLWSDDRIYHTARLIVSALIAKIHTVEWTPAILGTKADRQGPEATGTARRPTTGSRGSGSG